MQYILIAVFAYWFACLSTIPNKIARFLYTYLNIRKRVRVSGKDAYTTIRLKPFDCEKCLAFWLTLWYIFFPNYFPTLIIYAGCASALAITLGLSFNKFLR
jgi:hypothetical protein